MIQEILSKLDGVKGGGNQFYARCPCHDDKHQSLSVSTGADGRILLNCHAGCAVDDILTSLALQMQDLFPPEPEEQTFNGSRVPIMATYNYCNGWGELLYQKVRREGKKFSQRRPDGNGGWIYNRQGIPPVLYNLPDVSKAETVIIVEGEKDADRLNSLGFTATTGENGAGPGKWKPEYTEQLAGKRVWILGDNDAVGHDYQIETANALYGKAASVKILYLEKVWPEIPEHGDISDYVEKVGQDDALCAIAMLEKDTPEWEPTDTLMEQPQETQWEEPAPFDTVDVPDFPTECLPAPVAAFVEALAENTQTPDEMAAILSLGVLATAVQSHFELEVTPDWKEPLCLYTVAVAPPGERKSAVISALTNPLCEYEMARRDAERVEIEQNQVERSMLEQKLESAKKNAVKAKGDNAPAAKEEALALSAELAEFEDKHPFRLIVDDTTPEKLVDMMDAQKGCITVSSAEGGVFDSMSGRYDKGGGFDIYLKSHAGDPVTVDRIGRASNHIKNPRLTMVLTIQPEVLTGLMRNATFRGRGLCGRFLYSMCRSKVGHRNVDPPPIPYEVKVQYRQIVQSMLSSQDSGTIRLSDEANRVRLEYAGCIEQRLGNEWEHMRDWGGKALGATLRIAALIHTAEAQENPAEIPISAETMTAAVKIMEVLSVHAMAAYQAMGADESCEDAKYLLRRLESTGQDEISKRDLFDMCKGKFKKVSGMEPALQTLSDMNYIKEVEVKTGGRPTKKIIVNPMSKSSNGSKRVAW